MVVEIHLLLLLMLTISQAEGCKVGSLIEQGGKYCYQPVLKPGGSMTFAEVTDKCAQLGGKLGSVHSAAQNQKIIELARGALAHPDSGGGCKMLLGASSKKDGDFHWMDGSPMDYTNWDVGEPDRKAGDPVDWGDEFCIQMYVKLWNGYEGQGGKDYVGKWLDLGCQFPVYCMGLCQIPNEANG
ncbi:unnamed protein product, partial [Mesorhabditis spiculigera]